MVTVGLDLHKRYITALYRTCSNSSSLLVAWVTRGEQRRARKLFTQSQGRCCP
jgi:hypothetical protein